MKAWAALIIRGNLSSEFIYEQILIKPDYIYESSFTHWQLNSKLSESEPIGNHLYDILKQIAPSRKEIQSLQNQAEVLVYCSVDYNSEKEGGVVLEPRILTLLAHLGARLEIHRFQNSRELVANSEIQNEK